MMTWLLRVSKAAKKSIRSMPVGVGRAVSRTIRDLYWDPYPSESQELQGHRNRRKIRVDKYRILYRVGKNAVYVFRVEKRSGRTYRGYNPGV